MSKRILINASHQEETRVVVLSGNRLEEFDYENTARNQLKGNIYLAKITRVEPSLQAAFVEYGGNRHGFLPFSEIHSDYYRIPVADREALAVEEAAIRGNSLGEEEEEREAGEQAGNGAEGAPAEPLRETENEEDAGPAAKAESNGEQLEPDVRVDTLGGDEIEDDQRRRARFLRRYKIQEVIKRRQIILVQVSKEERGTKGAALTTYLSLAGRYCVLMPNTARGGGISRKISSATDRRRLKKILAELKIPDGMAVIVRTAGSQRSKVEIRRDYEYLMRLWSDIRETTLKSTAPCLIHEEANLIKRSIRDLYASDMEEVLVEGDGGYKAAKEFMRALIPSHAKKVQQYKDPTTPLFHKFKIEGQLDAIHSPTVQLKSGGYIVLNQTEALVAIDVNSGKATRERHIEETALKTNQEAADEVARQLRLRDLAGLIVIDFIDMEEGRHNRDVERRLKEAMRTDRARIQLGRISPFGLLELSRQRLRPSLVESSSDLCPRCGGTGHVRSIASSAINVLRMLEEEGLRSSDAELRVSVPTPVALHVLNQLRERLVEIEERYGFKIHIQTDDDLIAPGYRLERLTDGVAEPDEAGEDDGGRKRRRRPRRRRDEEDEVAVRPVAAAAPSDAAAEEPEPREVTAGDGEQPDSEERRGPRRRRGKRGGRKRARRRMEADGSPAEADTEAGGSPADAGPTDAGPADAGPTDAGPADAGTAEVGQAAEPMVRVDAAQETGSDEAEPAPRPKRSRSRRKPAARAAAEKPADESTGETAGERDAEMKPADEDTAGETAPRQAPKRPSRRRPSRRAAKAPPVDPVSATPLLFPPAESDAPDLAALYPDARADFMPQESETSGAETSPEFHADAAAPPAEELSASGTSFEAGVDLPVRTGEAPPADAAPVADIADEAERSEGDAPPAVPEVGADAPLGPEEEPPAVAALPDSVADEPAESEEELPAAAAQRESDGAAPGEELDQPKRRGWWQRLV